jgi:signal transduction histidine kinase
MNSQMASVLVSNLVRNAYIHTPAGGDVKAVVSPSGFAISNPGTVPLDKSLMFRRFYQPEGRREGSTGLGLALAHSVCEKNGMSLSYDFEGDRHVFYVNLKN